MVLISFFDEDPLDNIGDILFLKPEICIFLGEKSIIKDKKLDPMRTILQRRGLSTQIRGESVPAGDMEAATDKLVRLIQAHPDCILDVTGGTEMLIALAGNISDKFDVPIYQRKGRSSRIHWQNGCELLPGSAYLTVAEVVYLHGGMILSSQAIPEFNDDFYKDIPALWDIVRHDMTDYNRMCNKLASLASHSTSTDPLTVMVDGETYLKPPHLKHETLNALEKAGLIKNLSFRDDGITLTFRTPQIKEVLTKAGCLLEYATLIAADRVTDRAIGVSMDWDGDINVLTAQTRNEMDVMLTYGMTPICISCKNGDFYNEALYELDTVSRHFAGRFAKRIMVASCNGMAESTVEHLKQRARDTGIIPVFNVKDLTFREFTTELRRHLPRNIY